MPLFSQHTRPPRGASPHSAAPRPAMPGRAAATRRAPAPQPAPGATASALLKRYRPIETRATGGFGSVEVCLDARLQRRVAIKRIPLAAPFEVASNDARADALAEARTASLLQHPNIVTVIDFTYDSAYAYLVMEYVDGMSLEEFLATVDGNSLTYDECACIADALAQALSYAHENGVLHLDIKPANVLIDRSGHVKLADFGMATLTSAAGFGGARGGTIGYMPPEQLRGDAVDERSDVFALAAVLYESLCATAPFRAGTPADSLKRIDKGVIVPSSLLPDIPETSEEALLCALSPEPSERMASIVDFSDWFLPHLGDAREGRKSLARMIEKLTADDEGDSGETEATGRRRVWELDPAEGARTRHERDRRRGNGNLLRPHPHDPRARHPGERSRRDRHRRRRRHRPADWLGTGSHGFPHDDHEHHEPHRRPACSRRALRGFHRMVVHVGPHARGGLGSSRVHHGARRRHGRFPRARRPGGGLSGILPARSARRHQLLARSCPQPMARPRDRERWSARERRRLRLAR